MVWSVHGGVGKGSAMLMLVGTGFWYIVENGGRIIYEDNLGISTNFGGKWTLGTSRVFLDIVDYGQKSAQSDLVLWEIRLLYAKPLVRPSPVCHIK